MEPFQIDLEDPTPLHVQVAGEIRRSIAEGEANPGERLPPARDLAAVLGVNSNTVLRALHQFEKKVSLNSAGVAGSRSPEGLLREAWSSRKLESWCTWPGATDTAGTS
jgi:DNA-binding transcriptional MocR family regulator